MKVTIPSLLCMAILVLSQTVDAKKATDPRKPPKNAVLLSTVNALTLRAGRQTTARRASSIPQLTCSGPSHVCKLYSVDMMRCTNEGSDYEAEDIQWSCKANLPEEFKLGATEVGCEGYESSEDPYVLKGSCGVEYRLLLTELGEEKYAVKNEKSHTLGNDAGARYFAFFFIMLFIGIICLILWSIYNSWNDPNRPAAGTLGTGWGGGGGGGGGDEPPPPYEDYSSPPKKPTTRAPRSSSSRSNGGSRAATEEPWRPGFWTGTAAGAAGGYAAGRYANRNRAPPLEPETRQTGGSWFGGGRPSTIVNVGSGPSSSSRSSSSTPSYSTSRHESTGFGGTSRR
jgi:hypothetical protein